jgi:lipoprotein-releasing system permease protein
VNVGTLIARRYLRPRRLSIIAIIGTISVVGIVIGTAALVIVMALFNGFRGIAQDQMIGFGPHVQVVPQHGTALENAEAAQSKLDRLLAQRFGGSSSALVSTSKLVLICNGRTGVADGVGISADTARVFAGLRGAVFLGTFRTHTVNLPGIVVSSGVAEQLQLRLGDQVEVISPRMIEQSINTLTRPRGQRAIITGMFQSNAARDVDQYRVYVDRGLMQRVTDNAQATGIDATVQNPRALVKAKSYISASMGSDYEVRTWEDMNRGLVDTMKLERIGSFIVLALIVLVASFNVLVSLTLGVVEKQRDIAVLLAIGLAPYDIRRIYLIQGLTLGVISVLLGVGIGLVICWGQITFHWISFDMSQGFLVPALPLDVQWLDVVVVAAVGLVLAATAALYPASRAARTVVSDAIRVE